MSSKRSYGFGEVSYVPRADKFVAYLETSDKAGPTVLAETILVGMRMADERPLALIIGRDEKTGENQVWGIARHGYRGWGK